MHPKASLLCHIGYYAKFRGNFLNLLCCFCAFCAAAAKHFNIFHSSPHMKKDSALNNHPTRVKDTSNITKAITSNRHCITCFNKINSGKLAGTVLMQNANVVPIGNPLTIKLSITGITPVALE